VEAQVYAGDLTSSVSAHRDKIESLSRARPLTFLEQRRQSGPDDNVLVCVLKDAEVIIPMASMVDVAAQRIRLQKEADQNEAERIRLEARLEDGQFLTRAPAVIVEKERAKLASILDRLTRLRQELTRMGN
jgi:valyl-tRNA synthetase